MSRSGKIELEFADLQGPGTGGKYFFRLPIAQLEELQEKCDAGPRLILSRLYDGSWRVRDIREPIRLGLIGGGEVKALDAAKLVDRYVSDGSLLEHVIIAQAVIGAALAGVEDEPLKKKRSRRRKPAPETTTVDNSSSSPPSTSSAPPSVSTP